MVWVYTGDRLRNLTRIECEDFDIDVNEGRDEPDPPPTCPECGDPIGPMEEGDECTCERCEECGEVTDGLCGCIEDEEPR